MKILTFLGIQALRVSAFILSVVICQLCFEAVNGAINYHTKNLITRFEIHTPIATATFASDVQFGIRNVRGDK